MHQIGEGCVGVVWVVVFGGEEGGDGFIGDVLEWETIVL